MARLRRAVELRRLLPVVAAGLLLIAIAFPMWRITLTAPQYAGRALPVELYAYPRLGGEYAEVQLLNHYVGFYFPDPVYLEPNYEVHENAIAVPEWSFGPLPFVLAAIGSVFVALAPTAEALARRLRYHLMATIVLFAGTLAVVQYRLHQAGHALDPNAPLRGVEGFTPPVIGPYEIANISGYAWLGSGGYLTLTAVALLAVAYLLRDTDATVRDAPALVRSSGERAREYLRRRRGGDDGAQRDSNGGEEREIDRPTAAEPTRSETADSERTRSETADRPPISRTENDRPETEGHRS
ncbi:hypothetical protein [Natronorubrum texcoconense]|uniref:Uncharacterized protein n=1 Tax=Natronorubrum texcoconense TaxID=1095776 RepID=A0A1G9BWX5_9EURY|nr:hypothetical protein [Natronorubrum texcoconense]SDK43907.1 hypothetical protein SAMN04515672_3119 [Natronorubrum texcoconense]